MYIEHTYICIEHIINIILSYWHRKSMGSETLWGEFHGEHGAASLQEDREDQPLGHACVLLTQRYRPAVSAVRSLGYGLVIWDSFLKRRCVMWAGKKEESACGRRFSVVSVANPWTQTPSESQISPQDLDGARPHQFHQETPPRRRLGGKKTSMSKSKWHPLVNGE